jgi:uncharacterized protein with ParB-like and HNH nuclease domain
MDKKSISKIRKITKAAKDKAEDQLREKQKEVNFDTKDYPIEVLIEKFEKEDLIIPTYQRKFIWATPKKIRFIETVLLGYTIPFMFFSERRDGFMEIVDGAQRTQTLALFLQNNLELTGLKKLTTLNDFKFDDLPIAYQRKFKNKSIRVIILADTTSVELRQDLFNRINTRSY